MSDDRCVLFYNIAASLQGSSRTLSARALRLHTLQPMCKTCTTLRIFTAIILCVVHTAVSQHRERVEKQSVVGSTHNNGGAAMAVHRGGADHHCNYVSNLVLIRK